MRGIAGLKCVVAVVAFVVGAGGVAVAASFTDFEAPGFMPGESVQNHEEDGTDVPPEIVFTHGCLQKWFVPTAGTDEEVVDLGADPHGKVWRFSTAVDAGTLGQNPHSPHNHAATGGSPGARPPIIAGEVGSLPNDSCGAETTPFYYAELDFRSATGGAQPGFRMALSANSMDTRQSYVQIRDNGATGFDLTYYSTADGCGFIGTEFVTDLSYADWHTLGIEIEFVGGLAAGAIGQAGAFGNDVVRIYVDGELVHCDTTWESCVGPRRVDQLLFETRDEDPSFDGGGLYFDNVLVTDVNPNSGGVCPGDAVCVENPDPRSQGYWHRQCLGVPASDGGIDPGRHGRGPREPTEPGFVDELMPCAFARLEQVGFGETTCGGLNADPPNDTCEKALKQLTALILNVCSDKLGDGCVVDVSPEGCMSTSVGELIDEIGDLIDAGQCGQAQACAAAVNEGIGLAENGKDATSVETFLELEDPLERKKPIPGRVERRR